jgi:Holliday junction resolvasome RuvABC endonuclease subunit
VSARRLLALDLGAICGWAIGSLDDVKPRCSAWRLPISDALDLLGARIAALHNTIGPFLDQETPDLVVMPEGFRGRNKHEAAAKDAYSGIVRAECWRRDIPMKFQPENTVRAEMFGPGRRTTEQWKALSLAWCAARGIAAIDHNAADSAVFWCWTQHELLHPSPPKPARKRKRGKRVASRTISKPAAEGIPTLL